MAICCRDTAVYWTGLTVIYLPFRLLIFSAHTQAASFISAGGIIYEKYRAGIDIGSTTVKLVVLDDADEILYGEYRRHQAHTQETLSTLLEEAKKSVGECELQVCITGSGAINLGKALDISFVQEVVAVATALKNVRRRRMWRLNLAARMLRSYTLPAD